MSSIWSFGRERLRGSTHATTPSATRTPTGRGCLFAAVTAVILFTQGCGTVILASSWGARPEMLSVGSGRADVEAKLGRPVNSRSTSDGGRVDTYDYRVYKPSEWGKAGGPVGGADPYGAMIGAMIYLAVDMLVLTPYALHKLATHPRDQVEIGFGPDERVVWIGSPPPYGPPDDAVESPSVGEIRKRCWSRDGGESVNGEHLRSVQDMYTGCVMRGFAIWGIE